MSRRGLLRGGAVVGAGLAGAALIGCGGDDAEEPAPAQGAAGGGSAGATGPERPGVPVVKGAPKNGGTFTLADARTSPQHDMHTALNASIWHNLSERAMQPNPSTNELMPGIVERWEVPDSTHFVMHVRKGVKLHNKPPWNAREFDAEDLAFNINRIAGNTAEAEGVPVASFQRKDTIAGMERVEAVDKYTVRVTMKQPSSAYLQGFLEWRNVMMPKGVVEVGFKDPMKFAGPGAFQLTEFVPDVREVFARNPGYYRAGEPHFDSVRTNVVADSSAMLAGFISKQFSTIGVSTTEDLKTLKAARPDALLYSTSSTHWYYLRPNMKSGPLTDLRVRKALHLATDYQEIGDGFYGEGWAFTGPVFSGYAESWDPDKIKSLPGYNPSTKAKDIAEAQKLMGAAGHANGDGIAFEILHGPGTGSRQAQKENSLRFQAQMAKIFPGMKVSVRVLPDAAGWANVLARKDAEAMSFSSVSQPSAASEAFSIYHSKGGRNYGAFENAEADALLDKAAVELDAKARKEIFTRFQEKMQNEWMPILSFYVQPNKTMVQPNIGGYDRLVGPWSQGSQHWYGGLYLV